MDQIDLSDAKRIFEQILDNCNDKILRNESFENASWIRGPSGNWTAVSQSKAQLEVTSEGARMTRGNVVTLYLLNQYITE